MDWRDGTMNGNQLGGMLCRLCSSEQDDFVKFDKELEQNSFGLFGGSKKGMAQRNELRVQQTSQ